MNYFKSLTNRNKKHFTDRKYNLDLSYITPRIIVMAYPKTFPKNLIGNNITEVANFLNERHGNKYLLINLSDKEYDTSKFHGSVITCQIIYNMPPSLLILFEICSKIYKYLSEDISNVVVINCRRGEDRIGIVVCCYLLYIKKFKQCEDSFIYYTSKRLNIGEAITQKNQKRYIEYFRKILSEKKNYLPYRIKIKSIELKNLFEVYNNGYYIVEMMDFTENKMNEISFSPNNFKINDKENSVILNIENLLTKEQFGEIIIKIYYNELFLTKKLGKIGFNTTFIDERKKNLIFMANEIDPESLLINEKVPKNYEIIINYEILCTSCRELGMKYCENCTEFFDNNEKLLEKWKKIIKYKNEYLALNISYDKNILFGIIDSDDGEYILDDYKKNKINEKNKNDEKAEKNLYEENNNTSDENTEGDEGYEDKEYKIETNKKKNKLNDSFESECIIV